MAKVTATGQTDKETDRQTYIENCDIDMLEITSHPVLHSVQWRVATLCLHKNAKNFLRDSMNKIVIILVYWRRKTTKNTFASLRFLAFVHFQALGGLLFRVRPQSNKCSLARRPMRIGLALTVWTFLTPQPDSHSQTNLYEKISGLDMRLVFYGLCQS